MLPHDSWFDVAQTKTPRLKAAASSRWEPSLGGARPMSMTQGLQLRLLQCFLERSLTEGTE